MAAGLGFKTFTTGEVLTAADTNGYLMQGINVFASSAARAAAITSPQEGQYSYLKDTNALEYYDGAAWVGAPVGDITAVTAGKGLTGGGSSGDVTVSLATTAKGDLVVGTGTTTAAALTVGNNGETLVADSSTATGLRYQAPVQQNPVLNSALQVWQRGTSFTNPTSAASALSADRWVAYRSGWATNLTTTRQTSGLADIQYAIRLARNSGDTSAAPIFLGQNFESVNSIPFAGKTVTMSFYAKAGANFSSSGNLLTVQLYTGTGTDQNIISGLTGAATPISVTQAITTSYVRYSFTGTVGSSVTEIVPYFNYTPSGTAGANDWVEITGVQIEVGSVATPFKTYAGTIQGELAACQRYYYRCSPASTQGSFGMGIAGSSTSFEVQIKLPVTMRVAPTSVDYTTIGNYRVYNNGSVNSAASGTPSIGGGNTMDTGYLVMTSSSMTAGNAYFLGANNTGSVYLGFGAEL